MSKADFNDINGEETHVIQTFSKNVFKTWIFLETTQLLEVNNLHYLGPKICCCPLILQDITTRTKNYFKKILAPLQTPIVQEFQVLTLLDQYANYTMDKVRGATG